jgi:hypothetical protein
MKRITITSQLSSSRHLTWRHSRLRCSGDCAAIFVAIKCVHNIHITKELSHFIVLRSPSWIFSHEQNKKWMQLYCQTSGGSGGSRFVVILTVTVLHVANSYVIMTIYNSWSRSSLRYMSLPVATVLALVAIHVTWHSQQLLLSIW